MARARKLPANLLAGEVTVGSRWETGIVARKRPRLGEEDSQEESQDSQVEEVEQVEQGREQEGVGEWENENPDLLGVNIPTYDPPPFTIEQEVTMEACQTALDSGWLLKLYFY